MQCTITNQRGRQCGNHVKDGNRCWRHLSAQEAPRCPVSPQNPTTPDLRQELEALYKEADRLRDSMEDRRIMGLCHDHFEVMFYDALDHTQYRIETIEAKLRAQ